MPTSDEGNLQDARMDSVDFQNEPLNGRRFGQARSGRDLDVPGNSDETRTSSSRKQGGGKNKYYSLESNDNDNFTEGTP